VTGSPAGRVLALLERVQERPGLTAPRLADDLGVSERTVRRYVAVLQDLGIPVAAERGRGGGYRLEPGYRMAPLTLTTDEAVSITLALAVVNGPADERMSAGEAALSKLVRALPRDVSERVAGVLSAVTPPRRGPFAVGAPDPAILTALTAGVVRRRVVRVRHRPDRGEPTSREINPYGVVVLRGHTYVHGWCHLRRARRTFRLDRIERVDVLEQEFRAPAALDVTAAVERSLAMSWTEYDVAVLVHAPLADVEPHFARHVALCERVDDETTRLRLTTRNLDTTVLRLSDHPHPMTVEGPPELREAFERLARRLGAAAGAEAPSDRS